ncbi:MAG: response regulator transcription factor [Anaerolineaceae bacterium]|nr:response regulator transcription factor [Anaerolineaceae bacterium]
MGATHVLLIGRIQASRAVIANTLEKHYELRIATSGINGVALAAEHRPQVVVLDAVSMRTPGERLCKTLQEKLQDVPVLHLHPGPEKTARSSADLLLFDPVTPRKLTGAIKRLLKVTNDELVAYGPLCVNLTRRILNVNGQEIKLTPKQANLIEIFLRCPGQTLDRKTIMEKVWQTDYLGDTRTLDVHIRWIREAIEENPSTPVYLKTVRGVGYRLEIPVDGLPAK